MEKDMVFAEGEKEIEILEFRAGGNSYGMNINDIREILPYDIKPLSIPNVHTGIEGIIKPRDFLIPIVKLTEILKLSSAEEENDEMLLVTSIGGLNIAFHVDGVKEIHTIAEKEIEEPGKKLSTSLKNIVIGSMKYDNRRIEIIDFRKLINEINPQVNVG